MKNIWSMALSPTTATANQRASWLPVSTCSLAFKGHQGTGLRLAQRSCPDRKPGRRHRSAPREETVNPGRLAVTPASGNLGAMVCLRAIHHTVIALNPYAAGKCTL